MLLDIQNQSKIFCFEVKLKETHASVLDKQVELTMIPWPPSGKGSRLSLSRLIFESLLFRIPGLDGQFSHIFVADNELFEKTQKELKRGRKLTGHIQRRLTRSSNQDKNN